VAHELETLANGQTAFASARLSAWHQLGTVTDNTMKAEEIMAKAFLGNWGVRKIRLVGIDDVDGTEVQIPADDKRMTVRRNPVTGQTEYLGVVGQEYGVVQNEQCAEILDRLVDQVGGAHFETAGSLRRGKSVFVTMKLPAAMEIAGVDRMDLYLIGTTSHDGTAALRVDASPIRVVCANTQRAAFQHAVGTYTFRHTSNVGSQISQAREALGLMWKYMDTFQAAAERMINETLATGEFEKIVAQLWPVPEDASDKTRNNAKERLGTLKYLLRDADTQAAIRDSRWAGYQAITEYLDHVQPAKNPLVRANRVVSGKVPELKIRAFDLLKV
jgi:phage/plasmid-like protein (TIGR03299 family)